ncbi:hypothetical protein GIX79_10480 [Lactobacillus reuteri]|uniref:Secreted protein n=1 Tax=Limosilactobacillus reuteri TaxID=1598 RepID=A0AAW9U499_LIMRT|nr:hypothetical protein [Limosilactobacillus reuteri]
MLYSLLTIPSVAFFFFYCPAPPRVLHLTFQKQLTIQGAFINPYTFEDSIALLSSGIRRKCLLRTCKKKKTHCCSFLFSSTCD